MPFTHLSHGEKHLRIASDDGHQYLFLIEKDETGVRRLVASIASDDGEDSDQNGQVPEDARKFASVCARDFGLR